VSEQVRSYITENIGQWFAAQGIESPIAVEFDIPKHKQYGDLATNVAMRLAAPLGRSPREIATQICNDIAWDDAQIAKAEVAGPGFINFFIRDSHIAIELEAALAMGADYGKNSVTPREKILIEFVSANPTGPLTIGHGRQAVLGDTLARLLMWCGHEVEREYYFNNAGRQMRVLGQSLQIRYRQLLGEDVDLPEDHYQGQYLTDIARGLLTRKLSIDKNDRAYFQQIAEQEIFADIRQTLDKLDIHFNLYFNERDLYDNGSIDRVIDALNAKELVYEEDGATWFRTSQLGFEKDRVLVKSSGEPTYRLPDIAYHRHKFARGYDRLIDIFGADHIATYPDVIAALQALGENTEKMTVLIHQFVTLYEGDKQVKMSTRKANFVTLDELISEVGRDAVRFFFVMRQMNSHLNFDLQLAKQKSEENPVYYCQYAHARIASIFRNARQEKVVIADSIDMTSIKEEAELDLAKHLLRFPATILEAAHALETQKMTAYLIETASLFHRFYQQCRVIGSADEIAAMRLALLTLCQRVLSNGLAILGIEAPEKM
jgi:arginyl-tRNA synthetase